MKDEINQNSANAEELEKLYHTDKQGFYTHFRQLFTEYPTELLRFWDIRLRYEFPEGVTQPAQDAAKGILIGILAVVLWFFARIPVELIDSAKDITKYYVNVFPWVFIGIMGFYVLSSRGLNSVKNFAILGGICIVGMAYCILLTEVKVADANSIDSFLGRGFSGREENAQPFVLSYLHIGYLLWFVYGMAFSGFKLKDYHQRFTYLIYNGDLVIINFIINVCIGVVFGLLAALFGGIGLGDFVEFFAKNILTLLFCAAPLVATFIYFKYPVIGTKIAPVLANIFSILVLGVLGVFLVALPFSGHNPFEERWFLIVFNMVQILSMIIIFFGLTGNLRQNRSRINLMFLLALSVVATIISVIAFTGISYRFISYGYTPFRFVATIGNGLFLANMVMVVSRIYKLLYKNANPGDIEKTIGNFHTIYAAWACIVVFIFAWIL